jgi:hypothetical protein
MISGAGIKSCANTSFRPERKAIRPTSKNKIRKNKINEQSQGKERKKAQQKGVGEMVRRRKVCDCEDKRKIERENRERDSKREPYHL